MQTLTQPNWNVKWRRWNAACSNFDLAGRSLGEAMPPPAVEDPRHRAIAERMSAAGSTSTQTSTARARELRGERGRPPTRLKETAARIVPVRKVPVQSAGRDARRPTFRRETTYPTEDDEAGWA